MLSLCLLSIACAKPEERARTSPGGVPLPPITAADSTQRAGEVQQLVQRHLDAMAAGDVALIDSLTAADHVHVSDGQRLSAEQLLEKHRTTHAPKYEVDWIQTRVYNGDVVIVNAEVRDSAGARHHLTQVWTLVDDQPLYVKGRPAQRGPIHLAVRRTVLASCCANAAWEMSTSHMSPLDPNMATPPPPVDPNMSKPDVPNM